MGPVAEISQPERVAIIGAGVIGAAWAARWILCGSDALVYDPGPETERIVTEVAENARHSWERMGLAPVREGSLTITKSIERSGECQLKEAGFGTDRKIGARISVDRILHLRAAAL